MEVQLARDIALQAVGRIEGAFVELRIAQQDAAPEDTPDPVANHRHAQQPGGTAVAAGHIQPGRHQQENIRHAFRMAPGKRHHDRPAHRQADKAYRRRQAKAVEQVHQFAVVEFLIVWALRPVRPATPEMVVAHDPEPGLDQRRRILFENEGWRREAVHHDDNLAILGPLHQVVERTARNLEKRARRVGPGGGIQDLQVPAGPPIRDQQYGGDNAYRPQQQSNHQSIPFRPTRGTRHAIALTDAYRARS